MKARVSKKEVRNTNSRIISIGYCDIHFLLRHHDCYMYSAGIYGWSCDYYIINSDNTGMFTPYTVISTGYQPLSNRETAPDTELLRLYEKYASLILDSATEVSTEVKQAWLNKLLSAFVHHAVNMYDAPKEAVEHTAKAMKVLEEVKGEAGLI